MVFFVGNESDLMDLNRIRYGIKLPRSRMHIPWQVMIEEYQPMSDYWAGICGGMILNQFTVLSAAHCFSTRFNVDNENIARPNPRSYRIKAGSSDYGRPQGELVKNQYKKATGVYVQ